MLNVANDSLNSLLTSPDVALLEDLNRQLTNRFEHKFVSQSALNRQIVSFQANKSRTAYRWYKFKEAFSASLVEHLITQYGLTQGPILDPFAGSGTTLFAARELGLDVEGIELLPIGQWIINTRQLINEQQTASLGLSETVNLAATVTTLKQWIKTRPWQQAAIKWSLPELKITQGAYPLQTKQSIERFVSALQSETFVVKTILLFTLLCILESISYTRKDGQYLRWDYRSGRRPESQPFDKGEILDFDLALSNKLKDIVMDLEQTQPINLFQSEITPGNLRLHAGSCLTILPTIAAQSYTAIVTSPPYCNRYDYTRTYALELALLGVDEQGLINLRQQMLSCTVENRPKDLRQLNPHWDPAITAADQQPLLQAILRYFDELKSAKLLNNQGIPRMIRGYFYEMACVIAECSRVLQPGAPLFMINDNVRYAGISIPVDLICADLAEQLGFTVAGILVLPNGKGNSSQQMGTHGREALRKCVYYWRKL